MPAAPAAVPVAPPAVPAAARTTFAEAAGARFRLRRSRHSASTPATARSRFCSAPPHQARLCNSPARHQARLCCRAPARRRRRLRRLRRGQLATPARTSPTCSLRSVLPWPRWSWRCPAWWRLRTHNSTPTGRRPRRGPTQAARRPRRTTSPARPGSHPRLHADRTRIR